MAAFSWPLVVFDFGYLSAVLFCLTLAVGYVASLYIRASRKYGRDHPETIKERFLRVFIVCFLAVPFFWLCSTKSHSVKARDVFTWLGLRYQGAIFASILPLLLTMILFLGPLSLHYVDGIFKLYKDRNYWFQNFRNVIWLRNHIVGPLTEEFVFRACMLPVLVPSFGENWSLIICPLFFGVAHIHHLYEKIQEGVTVKVAVLRAAFQFGYTTIFEYILPFCFENRRVVQIWSRDDPNPVMREEEENLLKHVSLRTRNLGRWRIGWIRVGILEEVTWWHHCWLMRFATTWVFQTLREVFAQQAPTRYFVAIAFVMGLVLWFLLLFPLTSPDLYSNDLYYST